MTGMMLGDIDGGDGGRGVTVITDMSRSGRKQESGTSALLITLLLDRLRSWRRPPPAAPVQYKST